MLLDLIAGLRRWGESREWVGPDPYEALNSPLLRPLGRTPLARRLLIQLVRRSPLDLRRPLRIRPTHNAATVAHLLSAYSRLEALGEPGAGERARWALALLERLRLPGWKQPCWSYHFDVETRFFRYSAKTPNTIATAFAGRALVEAYDTSGSERALELAIGAGRFFCEHVALTPGPDGAGAFFGYFPGDRTPIHNASLLACSLLAELAARGGPAEFGVAAREGLAYAVAHQRPDGSWPYAEIAAGAWIDNFHTGYNLDALGRIARALRSPEAERARRAGLDFYARELFEPDGRPRFFTDSLYPIDGQCVAQAVATFATASELDPGWAAAARRVLGAGVAALRRSDGAFAYQRGRLWVNRTPHVRWVQAPMLEALAMLLAASGPRVAGREEGKGGKGAP